MFFGTLNSPIGLGYEESKVVDLQKRYVYASGAERYYDISSTSYAALATTGFSDQYAHLGLEKSAHKTMMGSTRTVKVQGVGYFPGVETLIAEVGGLRYLNRYRDTGCVAEPGSCDGILAHLAYLVPEEDERSHILDCFASLCQRPAEKIRHAWVIIGKQGTGKGFFTDVSKQLFGGTNVTTAPASDLGARFKSHLVDTQVLILGEMMVGDRRGVYEENKELFSEEMIMTDEKYVSPRLANTPKLIIGTSNHDRPVFLEMNERRFFIVKSPAIPKEPSYYKEFYGEILPREMPAFKDMLSKRDISAFSAAARPPMTVAKEQVVFESMSTLAQRLHDDIEEKSGLLEKDLVSSRDLARKYPTYWKQSTEREVLGALTDLGAERFCDGKPVPVGHGQKKRLWVVRNFEKWRTASSADARHHLTEGMVDVEELIGTLTTAK